MRCVLDHFDDPPLSSSAEMIRAARNFGGKALYISGSDLLANKSIVLRAQTFAIKLRITHSMIVEANACEEGLVMIGR